jgi:cytochrome c-type biogenesis protein CcmH/NrfG
MLDERYREARSGYLAVLSMRQTIRDRHGEATTLFKLAEVDVALNDFESAEHGYVAALAIQGELRDGRGEKRTLDGLAKVALRREADANDR